jgi:hypothetical protein
MEGVCLILGGSHILYHIHILGYEENSICSYSFFNIQKIRSGKTYSSSPFFPWDPQKSVSKAKNYSILGLGFASLHNHAEVRKKQLGYVMYGPCPAKVDRWCGLQVAYVLRLWQMSNQLDGVINLYLRAWSELASLHLNDMDRRIAQNHRSIWRVTDLKSVEIMEGSSAPLAGGEQIMQPQLNCK